MYDTKQINEFNADNFLNGFNTQYTHLLTTVHTSFFLAFESSQSSPKFRRTKCAAMPKLKFNPNRIDGENHPVKMLKKKFYSRVLCLFDFAHLLLCVLICAPCNRVGKVYARGKQVVKVER